MIYDTFWRSSSFILTNDEGNNKEKKNLWCEFQTTFTSTYTYFGHKKHLNVALIQIIDLQSFSLPHRQPVMCMLGCSYLYASGAAPGQNHGVCSWGMAQGEASEKQISPTLTVLRSRYMCVCIMTQSSVHRYLEVQPCMRLLLSCISTCSSKEVGPDEKGKR